MSSTNGSDPRPDFSLGVDCAALADGELLRGRVGPEPAVMARRGADFFVFGANAATITVPYRKACWSATPFVAHGITPASTFEAAAPRGLQPSTPARMAHGAVDGKVYAREKKAAPERLAISSSAEAPKSIVIVGAGAAGFSAAHTTAGRGL